MELTNKTNNKQYKQIMKELWTTGDTQKVAEGVLGFDYIWQYQLKRQYKQVLLKDNVKSGKASESLILTGLFFMKWTDT